jgi:hypothetical protein
MLKEVTLPSNFDVIFSDSGKQKNLIDVINDRHTKIFSSKSDLETAGYVNASEIDLYATKWFNVNNKIGLIFH